MKIISIANRKGGVGKTSITANLAYELKKRGFLVLLVDIDQQCDLTKVFLPDEKQGGVANIYTLLCGESSIGDACVEIEENLYMIPGSRDIIHFDFFKKANSLSNCLHGKRIAKEVDLVLIDHPPLESRRREAISLENESETVRRSPLSKYSQVARVLEYITMQKKTLKRIYVRDSLFYLTTFCRVQKFSVVSNRPLNRLNIKIPHLEVRKNIAKNTILE